MTFWPVPSRLAALAIVLAGMAGCGGENRDAPTGPVRVGVIGASPALVDPLRRASTPAGAAMLTATAQGLVAFDEEGRIVAGLAERWIVSDDGLSYIFRLGPARFGNGEPATAELVARRLRQVLAAPRVDATRALAGGLDEVVAMPNEVVEIRLLAPRPRLLELLAGPDFAILHRGTGTGPFMAAIRRDGAALAARPPTGPAADPPPDAASVQIDTGRAALMVARFAADGTDVVLGGRVATLPIAQAAQLPGGALRIDPADGLFGLAFAHAGGLLADQAVRAAIAMAIDRQALVEAFGAAAWQPQTALVPAQVEDLPRPALPRWSAASLEERRVAARAIVAIWQAANDGTPAQVRIALGAGPGERVLFARVRADLRLAGVEAVRVEPGAAADLRLIDAVAPADSAAWYLSAFTCNRSPACSAEADAALAEASRALDAAEAARLHAQADELMTAQTVFVPLARPLRWSLASTNRAGFATNRRAAHPLLPLANAAAE